MKQRKSFARKSAVVHMVMVLFGLYALSCIGGPRFEPGDPIGIPPLPPYDLIVGFFSKFEASDGSGVYVIKDLPTDTAVGNPRYSPMRPSFVAFKGEYLLYFLLQTRNNANGIRTDLKVAKMMPASPYIDTGPNGIAESGLGGDDEQWQAVGTEGLLPTDIVVFAGGNGILETYPAGDDVVSIAGTEILAGPNGVAESGLADGDLQIAFYPTLSGYLSALGVPTNDGEPNRLAVSAGANGILETPCVLDDNLRRDETATEAELVPLAGGIYTGIDGIAQSGLGGDDVQLRRAGTLVNPFELLILPGSNGVLETLAKGKTDEQRLPLGTIVGSADEIAIGPASDGKLHTCPSGDDLIFLDGSTGKPEMYIRAGYNLVVETIVSGDDMYAALDGGDGVVHSGVGGDDFQIISAGNQVPDGLSLPVVSAGADDVLQTYVQGDEVLAIYHLGWATGANGLDDCIPPVADPSVCSPAATGLGGDDIQVVAGGTTGLNPTDVVVSDGGNTVLETLARGDDVVSGTDILAGPNGVAESGVWGDDVQVARRGSATLLYLDLNPVDGAPETALLFPVILPGNNGILETPLNANDDLVILEYGTNNDAGMENYIATYYGVAVSLPDGDGVVSSGLGGRGAGDALIGCATTLDNGGTPWVDNPFTGLPASSVCLPRNDDVQNIPLWDWCWGAPAVTPGANGILETQLGGDDELDPTGTMILCGGNDMAESFVPHCSDDCQLAGAGSSVTSLNPIIVSGGNGIFDTNLLGDDGNRRAIVDGGNGVAESGLGGDDVQVIPRGRGQPYAMEIVASPTNATGGPRVLNTIPAGDDRIVYPATIPGLGGDGELTPDNPYTLVDPDGDGRIENYATVDDGEYFAWENTNVTNDFLPPLYGDPATGDVVDDVQSRAKGSSCWGNPAVTAGGNGVLETAPAGDDIVDATGTQILCGGNNTADTLVDRRGLYSVYVVPNPANANQLLAYMSNGRDIYLTRSDDGRTWDIPQLVLSPGASARATDPVVMSGVDGICETPAEGDDIQNIALGRGLPNTPAIFAGKNKMLESLPQGDDYISGNVVYTGPNGIRETPALGDDWTLIGMGKGQPDSPCVLAGSNGRRDTSDTALGSYDCPVPPDGGITVRACSGTGAVVADDRPPFVDRNGNNFVLTRNSAYFNPTCNPFTATTYGQECPWLPELNEWGIRDGTWAGFDAFAVRDPFVFVHNGTYYMYYAGVGAIAEPQGTRPSTAAFEFLGPCTRTGLNGTMNTTDLTEVRNADNDASVVVAERIGLATSTDGVHWTKVQGPVLGLGNVCGSLVDLSMIGDLIGGLPFALVMPGATQFDYAGASMPVVVPGTAADGSTIFAMIYTGTAENFTALENNGRAKFGGFKTGVGLARSWDGVNWTKMDDFNPLFIPDLLGGLLGGLTTEEGAPSLQGLPDSYLMYHQERNFQFDSTINEVTLERYSLSVARRYGAVYGSCLSVARSPFSSAENMRETVAFMLLLISPAIILVGRRIWRRKK